MKHYLMTPGPSPLAKEVKEALGRDIIHHRTDEFSKILEEVHSGLKYAFQTKSPVLVLASSGTGAMEAAVCNLMQRGDKALVINGGKFGERWEELCRVFGIETVVLNVEWGTSPCPSEIKKLIERNPGIKAVYTTLTETSTATVYDIEGTAKITKDKDILLVVDAISGLAQDPLKTDAWGVDVVVCGSQKGFMLPPGLAFISLNEKAQGLLKTSNLPKYYFDLSKALAAYEKNDTPFTPAVSLIAALAESLKLIKNKGLENCWEDFKKMSQAVRLALEALGFKIFSRSPSYSVTAGFTEELDTGLIVKKMRKEKGISIAGGQGKLKGKIIRIAHMGDIKEKDVIRCLKVLEEVLAELGRSFNKGASIEAFQEVYHD